MAFVQFKLDKISDQTRGIFDVFVYRPDNGDSSTNVAANGYFSESRFIDDWNGSLLLAQLSDGLYSYVLNGDTATLQGPNLPDDVCRSGWGSYFNGDQTPINIPTGVETKLTLTTTGGSEIEEYLPLGVSGLWDSTNSQFDFSSLEVGDMVDIRVDGSLTNSGLNESFALNLVVGIGSPSEFTLPFSSGNRLFPGTSTVSRYNGIFIGSENAKNFPSELRVITTDPATAFLIDIYIKVLKRTGGEIE